MQVPLKRGLMNLIVTALSVSCESSKRRQAVLH